MGSRILQLDATNCSATRPTIHSEGALLVDHSAFRLLFDHNPRPMWIYDARTREFLCVNDAAVRNYMYTRREFGTMTIDQLEASQQPSSRNADVIYSTNPSSTPSPLRHCRKDRTTLEVEIVSQDMMFNGRSARLVLATDVTGRERAQEALRETKNQYQDLFDHANDVIFTTDLDGRLTSLNKAGEIVTGYSAEEARRTDVTQILGPKSLELARSMREKKMADGGETTYEIEIARKDGRLITLAVRTSLTYQGGTPHGIRGIARDISERKQLEDELRQTQKMEVVGRLASGVAHDFNNLLGVIMGYCELLSGAVATESPLHAWVEEAIKAGQRAASLTDQLLTFGRRQVLKPVVLDLDGTIANIERLLHRLIREDIELTLRMAATTARVKADPVQIEQVLLNLAVNARDAMPGGGELKIETAIVNVDDGYARQGVQVAPGRYVLITVSDTGVGMDEQTKANIFEPFFTTKPRGRGTGLGLATVYGIVKQSGGAISVNSQPGMGASFMIYLPCVDEAQAQPSLITAPAKTLSGTETILVVDDSAAFIKLVRTFLEKQGYTVLEARTSSEASQIATRHRGPIHLLLTDVIMPDVNGYQLSDYLRFHRREMGVLYMSGYGGPEEPGREAFKHGAQLLSKPFCKDALLLAVRQTLVRHRAQNAMAVQYGVSGVVASEYRN
jgi:two-component system cell cycle sensor histidine kinase/response regulator CckA